MNRADFINLFADRVALWPNELYSRLSAYGLAKTTEQWQQVRDALSPFMRAGRLPAEVSRKVFIPPAPKRSNNQQRATGKSASDIRRPTTLMLARGGMNHEDLVVNTGREPIQHFAVFSARGDKANKRFDLEIVDTVEDLFTWSNLEGYIGRHGSDSTLRPLLHAIIEHLRVDPKGSAHTQRLRGVEYYLGDATDPRAPWRFSPQHFPATSKGPIATRTRVIYDVLNHRGHPTLAVYGAFIKADIEDMSRLPRIR